MKFFSLILLLLVGVAHAEPPLKGRAALEAIYGRNVVFHESIAYDVTFKYFPNGHMTMTGKGKTYIGRYGDAENDVICTLFPALNNIMVCHSFKLKDNILTKIDQASKLGNEGQVADGETLAAWPNIVPEFCDQIKKAVSAAQSGSFDSLIDKTKVQSASAENGTPVFQSKIAVNRLNCVIAGDVLNCSEPISSNSETAKDLSFDGNTSQIRACIASEIISEKYDTQYYQRSANRFSGDRFTLREAFFKLKGGVRIHVLLRSDKDCRNQHPCLRGLATDIATSTN